jgi:cyanophycinase-like exopeptidase
VVFTVIVGETIVDEMKSVSPGLVVLFGSGETSPSGRKVFDLVLRKLPIAPQLALLETPAGFELNSEQVIERVADFIRHRLQNYQPQVDVIAARKRGTPLSPDNPEIVAPLLAADVIFMGPGSPSYAVRQLRDSLAWQYLLARHRLGAHLVLASAATIAISKFALPVYEVYKVGEDLHWKPGLDLFGLYGLPLVFIPHWNNKEGGEELDTSRCFMGQSRFIQLMEMLPPDLTVLGLDENTALIMDVEDGTGQVVGSGGVTLIHTGHAPHEPGAELEISGLGEVARLRRGHVHHFTSGTTFSLNECCPFEVPATGEGLPVDVWQQALQIHAERGVQSQANATSEQPPAEVLALVEKRQAARQNKDWAAADALRGEIAALGWQVLDTPQGPKVEPASS